MRWRKSKQAPTAFRRWCRDNAPIEDHAWEDLGVEAKDQLRERLRSDQSGLCAYCYVRLGEATKIEHVVPQAPTTRFDWENLALCCPGTTDGAVHCDSSKGDRPLADVEPYHRPVADRARLRLDGRLTPDDSAAGDVNDVLRLDHPGLRRRREAALRAWLGDPRSRISAGGLERALTELRARTEAESYQPLVERWLERQLRKR